MPPELRPYQNEGVAFLEAHPRSMLGDDPGLGKSAQLLRAAEGKTLVVAPAMVLAAGVWSDQAALWRPDLDLTTVSYSSLTGRERTEKGGSRPTNKVRPEYKGPWDSVIFDEAHNLKGRKTTWAVASLRIEASRVHLASGTPIPNWAFELWMLLRHLYPGDKRFSSFWRWAGEWFQVGPTRWSPMEVGDLRRDRTWAEFHEANLGDRYLARTREEVLPDLPPLSGMHPPWVVPMHPKQATAYKQLRREFMALLDSGQIIESWNKAAQTVQLAKLATGLDLFNDGADRGSGKLDALRAILEGETGPVLVPCHFKAAARAVERLCTEMKIECMRLDGDMSPTARGREARAFQAGKAQVLVCTIASVREGIPLTRATRIVMLEHSYLPSHNEQVIRRVHRLGQESPVTLIRLVTANTMDERIQTLLAAKTDQQMKALRPHELREII